jgi:uncharacterized membrane-anchored protein YitT (DUF2179 family)
MTVYEHLITLGAFILALGIASILAGLATLVHRRTEARLSAAQLLWMAAIFLELVNFWLGTFNYRDLGEASFITTAFVVIYPTLLFLQAELVTPEAGQAPDLVANHAHNHRYYAGLAALCGALEVGFLIWADATIHPVPVLVRVLPAFQGLIALAAVIATGRWVQNAAATTLVLLGLVNFVGAASMLVSRP